MNWKYLNRRALYLHHIATSLKERFPSYEMHYEWLHDDCDKPVLVLALHILISPCPQVLPPNTVCSCGSRLRILPVPSESVFPLSKLSLAHNNVHVTVDDALPSTWFYNSMILEDMLLNHYTQFILAQAHQVPVLLRAGILFRVGLARLLQRSTGWRRRIWIRM